MKLVILITAKTEAGFEVAQAWRNNGAPGVTIIRAHGFHTLSQAAQTRLELPRMLFSMADAMASLIEGMEENALIFISVMSAERVEQVIDASTAILGDLLSPHTGVIFVLDVERAIGVRDHGSAS